ncbi:MAG TPA: rRNA maturation RNase YbeY [Planctomycetaceae bacterium]|nr:rRNA maturation RNase YbeY [Planctomycetaceae bacterium]
MPSTHLSIQNRQSAVPVDIGSLEQKLRQAIAVEETASVDVTVLLVDDVEIHRLNREFLNHDWPTDVITFFNDDTPAVGTDPDRRGRGRHLTGELVVSVNTAEREAVRQGWRVDDELLLYCVHGWLHLCGYDDLTDDERPLMRQRERELLALFGLTPTDLED